MKRLAGFTFIELMIAVSIFAIVAVAIYSTFGTGISAWRKTQKTQNLYQDVRLAMDRIAGDLENAVLYKELLSEDEELSNFAGKKNKVSFYSLVNIYQTIPVHPELKKVTYNLEGTSLLRLEENFAESVPKTEKEEPEQIATKIKSLNFFYYDKGADSDDQWQETWDFEDSWKTIPPAVKIELEIGENLIFTKYAFIPTAEKN